MCRVRASVPGFLSCCVALSVVACQPTGATVTPTGPATPTATAAAEPVEPVLAARTRIFDKEGTEHTYASMFDALAGADAVFVGETHHDDVTHRIERAVLEGIAARRDGKVVLSMEMFERDVQPILDEYIAGTRAEAQMLAEARPWANYATGYRPLVESAKSIAAPVVAANLPRPLIMELSGKGKKGWEAVRKDHPTWVPQQVFAPEPEYWARVTRVLRGHFGGAGGDPTWSVQNLWDNTMGESVAIAHDAHPDATIVHVAGGFHVSHFSGTVAQFSRRRPEAKPLTVSIVPTHDLAVAAPRPDLADFVVYAESYAKGPNGGRLSVTVHSELSYRLDLPDGTPPDGKLPLLVWLADDGVAPGDAALRWRLALGGQAAVIVVDPPIPTQLPDGRLGKRWAYPSRFAKDVGPVAMGLSRLVEYATRRLPVDPARVVVAGEGNGAAVVLWTSLYEERDARQYVAISPALPHDLQVAAIPDGKPAGQTLVVDDAPDRPAMTKTAEAFDKAGAPATLRRAEGSAAQTKVVLDALGVDAPPAGSGETTTLHLRADTAAGRTWAQLWVDLARTEGRAVEISTAKPPRGAATLDEAWVRARLASGAKLPRPPAAFGGATIIVLPGRPSKVTADAWTQLVETAAKTRGRFAPLVLVREADLATEIATQADKTSNILVVPAAFAAPDDEMARLRTAAGPAPEGVNLYWLPGLGGAAAHAAANPAK